LSKVKSGNDDQAEGGRSGGAVKPLEWRTTTGGWAGEPAKTAVAVMAVNSAGLVWQACGQEQDAPL